MIISDTFVFLHPPKTGGTFVTEALIDIYSRQFGKAIIMGEKHAAADGIPAEHSLKKLVTLIRNPFDYYASHYRFGYWIDRREEPWVSLWDEEPMRERFAGYPYLEFAEFIEGALEIGHKHLDHSKRELSEKLKLGPLTIRMLQFSVPSYINLLERLTVEHDTSALKRAVAQTRFLHTESLNRDTYRWLIELGVPTTLADPMLLGAPIQPLNMPNGIILKRGHGQPRREHWTELFDEHTMAAVIQRDWLFFELFPEYAWDAGHAWGFKAWRSETLVEEARQRFERLLNCKPLDLSPHMLCRLFDLWRTTEQRLHEVEQASSAEINKRDEIIATQQQHIEKNAAYWKQQAENWKAAYDNLLTTTTENAEWWKQQAENWKKAYETLSRNLNSEGRSESQGFL